VGLVLIVLVAGIVAWRRSRRHTEPAAAVPVAAAPVQTWTAWYAPENAVADDSPTVVWTPATEGAADPPTPEGGPDGAPEPPPPPA
jgi:hypothetical protein